MLGRKGRGLLALTGLMLLTTTSCGGDAGNNIYWFNGRVYDGATGARITGYQIRLLYRDRSEVGSVEANGRYLLGPLQPFADYTVEITANGYRSFLSHNPMRNPPVSASQTFYYDAYLFPNSLRPADTRVRVTLADVDATPANGAVRLQPSNDPSLARTPEQTPVGVGDGMARQIWMNDEDLQFRTVTRPITDGVASFAGADLVYGVSYRVTVFGVSGHQDGTDGLRAGIDSDRAVVLQPYEATELNLSFNSASLGVVPSGEVVLVLNQPFTIDPTQTDAAVLRALDAGIRITSFDDNNNGMTNRLRDDTPAGVDRGVGFQITGNRFTLRWDRANALAMADAGDFIREVSYGGLGAIRVRPVGGGPSTARSLRDLVGADSVTVRLAQE